MAVDPVLPLQAAIVAAVEGDTALGALGIDTVYDHVPDRLTNAATPNSPSYCSFGSFNIVPDNTVGRFGASIVMQIDTWTRTRGRVQALQIMAALRTLLERNHLTATGITVSGAWLVLQQTMLEDDGVTVHGVQQFRFVTYE